MYIINKTGLSTVPWGVEKHFVFTSPRNLFNFTCWGLTEINVPIKLIALPLIP